jgi:hypothetical protein
MKSRLPILLVLLIVIVGGAVAIVKFKPVNVQRSNDQFVALAPTDTVDAQEIVAQKVDDLPSFGDIRIAPGILFDNLQIFLIYANAEIPGERYVPLDSALNAKYVSLRETSNVNELKLDNTSKYYIYINSGDIVRGGKQDRTIQYDVIIPPTTKNIDIASFCVESGRWNERSGEEVRVFSSSKNALSSKELKLAAKERKNQQEVWSEVAAFQEKASEGVSLKADQIVEVRDQLSSSSLELTLENKELKKLQQTYLEHFKKKLPARKGSIGMAYYINGELASADLFNNEALFRDLFSKLLDAAIAEAISELKQDMEIEVVSQEHVSKLLSSPAVIKEELKVNSATGFTSATIGKHQMLFTSEDLTLKKWLHKNWLEKDK